MTRTIRTNFIRALQRQNVDSTPFPKASDDISLVNIVQNSAHLGPMVTNAHSACNVTTAAGGAATFSGMQLVAPADRTLVIYYIDNTLTVAGNLRCALSPAGTTFTPALASPCMDWGDEPIKATINSGLRNFGLVGDSVFFGAGAAGFPPVYVAPGELFACQHASANTAFTMAIAWEEFG